MKARAMLKNSVGSKNWNWFVIAVSILASILFIVMSLFSSILMVAFDIDFYEAQYELLGRPQAIGISEEELMRVTGELLDYIAGRREALDTRSVIRGEERYVFNDREIAHMVDVRDLFNKSKVDFVRNPSLNNLFFIAVIKP